MRKNKKNYYRMEMDEYYEERLDVDNYFVEFGQYEFLWELSMGIVKDGVS